MCASYKIITLVVPGIQKTEDFNDRIFVVVVVIYSKTIFTDSKGAQYYQGTHNSSNNNNNKHFDAFQR